MVEENNLQVQVSALRKLLGQDAIATVAGHGYRFTLEPAQVEAPAPSPVRVARDNLPAQVASFIGRERELIDLRAMLANHRLVTLVGIGGIGKTRLALALATSVTDAYADGVWFVDLAPISDPRLVVNAIAATLGVREEPGRPIIETLRQFVADRTLLLVLDNCEHLLLACAPLARDLLQASGKLTIVATSREPLHVPGEVTFPLATLRVPDPSGNLAPDVLGGYSAVQLFLDRAIGVRPDFALTRENAAAVARICRDLDGIPLALELAAARVRSMSADAIAGHLTDRFALLKGTTGRHCRASRRCARRSTGAMTCSRHRNARCCSGCRCSPVGSRSTRRRPSAAAATSRPARCWSCWIIWSTSRWSRSMRRGSATDCWKRCGSTRGSVSWSPVRKRARPTGI